MKRAVLILLAVLVLTGCVARAGDGATPSTDGGQAPAYHKTYYQSLPDGRVVLCVWIVSGGAGGLSCDWDNATEPTP